jgi:hypothetical protein
MQVRGPLASTQERSEPPPLSLRLVTSITTPPRPPTLAAPPPCAVGKAAMAAGFFDGSGVGSEVGVGVGVGVRVRVGFGDAAVTFNLSWPTQLDTRVAKFTFQKIVLLLVMGPDGIVPAAAPG